MYGGAGIGSNAGGVRCGNFGDLQIKGIGPSILAGPGRDKWHRHGAMSLQDAVRETLLGELLSVAGPNGAIRALAILDLGFDFATEVGKEKLPDAAPRALLYREQCVRVAHFMRSSFMNVGHELAGRELARMRDGIPRLVNWLCEGGVKVSFENAARALLRVFDLHMSQLAVLRTKRLVHGSLIPSNFCIDGRLVDFTTTTAVSTLQPVLVSVGGWSSHHQHHQVLLALPELLFYISKFDCRCSTARAGLEEHSRGLVEALSTTYNLYLMREHLGLIGLPIDAAQKLDEVTKSRLLSALVALIECGSVQGHLYFGGKEHLMLPQAGCDDLLAVISEAICETTGLSLPQFDGYRPDPHAFPPAVRREFIQAFGESAKQLAMVGPSLVELGMVWLIRATQRNADLTPLYRCELDLKINEICRRQRTHISEFIKLMVERWSGIFATPSCGRMILKGWLTQEDVSLSPDGRLEIDGQLLSPLSLPDFSEALDIRGRHQWLFEVAAHNRARLR